MFGLFGHKRREEERRRREDEDRLRRARLLDGSGARPGRVYGKDSTAPVSSGLDSIDYGAPSSACSSSSYGGGSDSGSCGSDGGGGGGGGD